MTILSFVPIWQVRSISFGAHFQSLGYKSIRFSLIFQSHAERTTKAKIFEDLLKYGLEQNIDQLLSLQTFVGVHL